jgi:hypothetical protein
MLSTKDTQPKSQPLGADQPDTESQPIQRGAKLGAICQPRVATASYVWPSLSQVDS